jgi:hypothetical protein
MGRRLELQALLESLAPNVYFQPPPSLQMQYPCVVYARDAIATEWSGNKPYSAYTRYQVTVIDRNPDSLIPGYIGMLPMCIFDRAFAQDQLNHDVFNLYY